MVKISCYRESAKKLLVENEILQNKLVQSEKDTLQVVSFLKKEDVKKEEQVNSKLFRVQFLGYHAHQVIVSLIL